MFFSRRVIKWYSSKGRRMVFSCVLSSNWAYSVLVYPRMRRASWISLGMMVTRRAWMAHKFVSSNIGSAPNISFASLVLQSANDRQHFETANGKIMMFLLLHNFSFHATFTCSCFDIAAPQFFACGNY